MKKEFVIIFLIILLSTNLTKAIDYSPASEALGEEFGIDEKYLDSTPQEIKERFLKQQWEETIDKNRVLGPPHRLMQKISSLFEVILKQPYEISLLFFLSLIFWAFLAFILSIFLESITPLKSYYALIGGIIIAIILAQINFISLVINFFLDLFLKQENWGVRTIIIVITLGIILFGITISKMLAQTIKKKKEENVKKKAEEQVQLLEKITAVAK